MQAVMNTDSVHPSALNNSSETTENNNLVERITGIWTNITESMSLALDSYSGLGPEIKIINIESPKNDLILENPPKDLEKQTETKIQKEEILAPLSYENLQALNDQNRNNERPISIENRKPFFSEECLDSSCDLASFGAKVICCPVITTAILTQKTYKVLSKRPLLTVLGLLTIAIATGGTMIALYGDRSYPSDCSIILHNDPNRPNRWERDYVPCTFQPTGRPTKAPSRLSLRSNHPSSLNEQAFQ